MSKRRLYTLMKDRMYTNCNNTGDKYTKLKTEEKIPRPLLRSLAISDRMCYKQRDTAPLLFAAQKNNHQIFLRAPCYFLNYMI